MPLPGPAPFRPLEWAAARASHRTTSTGPILGLALLAVGLAACSTADGEAQARDAPVVAALDGTDPDVAASIRERVERAREAPEVAAHRGALGMAYDVAGLPAAALASYRQAAALDPTEPRWAYYQALILAPRGDVAGALAAIDEALALEPDYPPAHLHRGRYLLDLGRVDEARAAYTRARELDDRDLWAWVGLARVHLASGEIVEAVALLEELAGRQDAHPYVFQLLGQAYRRQGNLEGARSVAVRGRPEGPPAFADPWNDEKAVHLAGFGADLRRAEALLFRGRRQQAIQLLETLRGQRPADATVLNNLSVAYAGSGQPEEALRVLREGLEARPDYYPFHLNIASRYRALGDLDRALEHLDRAIELNPRLAFAHHQKGQLLVEARRPREALASFEKALEYDATTATTPFFAGLIEADLGRWPQAAERLRRAVELDPQLGPAWLALARAELERGSVQAASDALARAAELPVDRQALADLRRSLANAQRRGS